MKKELKKIMYDHDFGADCDDGGAIAMLVKAHKKGRVNALCITDCAANKWGSLCTKALCEYFEVDDIVIGANHEDQKLATEPYECCTRKPAEKWFEGRELPEFESNVRVWRRILANNGGKKDITVATSGPLNTIFNLFKSGPDDISNKTGRELFIENVEEFIIGGGHFVNWEGSREYNFWEDSESSCEIINNPIMPLTFFGNNVAGPIVSGNTLHLAEDRYPLKESYLLCTDSPGYTRFSWDLGVIYWAIYGSGGLFDIDHGYTITIDEEGHTFWKKDGGMHSITLRAASDELITRTFDEFMMP